MSLGDERRAQVAKALAELDMVELSVKQTVINLADLMTTVNGLNTGSNNEHVIRAFKSGAETWTKIGEMQAALNAVRRYLEDYQGFMT